MRWRPLTLAYQLDLYAAQPPVPAHGSTQGPAEALGGGRQWWMGVAAVKICSRLWLAMPGSGCHDGEAD